MAPFPIPAPAFPFKFIDDTTYDTVFQTTKGDTLIVRVNVPLASSFSIFCPAMTLAGVTARHPWVDARMRVVGYNPLESEASWKASNLTLGQAVHAVVKHIQLNPPEILEFTDSALESIQTKKATKRTPPRKGAPPSYDVVANSPTTSPPSSFGPNVPPAPPISLPAIPRSFPELDSLSRAELDGLMEDEFEFLSFVHKLETSGKLREIENNTLESNATLAEENLANESQLQDLLGEVKGFQETLRKKVEDFSKLESEQNALIAPPDKTLTIKALTKANKMSYDESEAFGEDWVEENNVSVEAFCKSFIARRKVHHTRAAKLEILKSSKQ
jgi:ESCRT-I complex subunit VPS37